jgi:DNA-binding GntR family transcriptional regulator
VKVDHHDPLRRPYQVIADHLRTRIDSKEFTDGKLPSAKTLQGQYEVSNSTIQRAVGVLKDAGIVIAVPNRGFYICDPGQPDRIFVNAGQGQLTAVMADLRALQERVLALEAENAKLGTRTLALEKRLAEPSL